MEGSYRLKIVLYNIKMWARIVLLGSPDLEVPYVDSNGKWSFKPNTKKRL